jgi:hypothetical protein
LSSRARRRTTVPAHRAFAHQGAIRGCKFDAHHGYVPVPDV